MDKQTYEKLVSSTNQVISDFDGMESLIRYHIKDDYLPRSRRYINNIVKFIESQKPLEIVVGGMYEIKSNFHARDGETGESVIFNPHLLIEVENVSPNFVVFDYEYSLFSICKDQFNQHNFMKVEDK